MAGHDADDPGGAPTKLWGGRFQQATDPTVERFSASVSFDQALAAYDIRGSIAHARMLEATGLITAADAEAIVAGLEGIGGDIAAGRFEFEDRLEDIHMNVESALRERIGEAAGRLHTGRSRNDQVATDVRLWTRGAIDDVVALVLGFQRTLLGHAEAAGDAFLP
ncbi:MAG: lyase family protein, partial [Myxococcota bacterium]